MVNPSPRRDAILDFLRGYFLFVIIVDHMRDEPHVYMLLTGGGRLWVSAAEGFVLISGFLLGKLRGAEARAGGLGPVSRKVLRRAATLALWTVLVTEVLLLIPAVTGIAPHVPEPASAVHQTLGGALLRATFLRYVYGDHNILAAYALFLAATPLILWCLLRGHVWLLGGISVGLWIAGLLSPQPLELTGALIADLSWQLLFVIGVAAGFHHDALARRWQALAARTRTALIAIAGAITVTTLALSWWRRFHEPATLLEHRLFAHVRLGPARLVLALIWILFAYAVVQRLQRWLLPALGPFLVPLGKNSLYVFIVHALLLFPLAGAAEGQFWMASLQITAMLAAIWALVRWRVLFGVIPR